MRNPLQLALFLMVVVTVVGLTHAYLYRRTVRDLAPPDRWRRLGRLFWTSAALFLLAGAIGFRFLPPPVGVVLAGAAFSWLGLLAIVMPITLLGEPFRIVGRMRNRAQPMGGGEAPTDPQRRVALARFTAAVTVVGSTSVAAAGVRTALADPELRELEVPLPRLPRAFDGLRIVQLSDIHVGPTIGREFTERLVERVDALSPDLVVITGDLVDGSVAQLAADVAPLATFKTRFGTFFCTGNHEYYSGADPWCEHLESIGITVLRNRHTSITHEGSALDLIGVDDWGGRGRPGGFDLEQALAGRDASRCGVLLSHQPKGVLPAAEAGLDLVLSGHTHGGQIWPYNYVVALMQPYVAGLHRHTERTWIYVHTGTGYWGPPVRVRIRSEIALLRLVSGQPPVA